MLDVQAVTEVLRDVIRWHLQRLNVTGEYALSVVVGVDMIQVQVAVRVTDRIITGALTEDLSVVYLGDSAVFDRVADSLIEELSVIIAD